MRTHRVEELVLHRWTLGRSARCEQAPSPGDAVARSRGQCCFDGAGAVDSAGGLPPVHSSAPQRLHNSQCEYSSTPANQHVGE